MGLFAPGRIYPGQTVRLTGVFFDTEDDETEPTVSIALKLKSPTGEETTYTYLTDEEVQEVSNGRYTADVRPTEGGRWRYRWEATSGTSPVIYVAGEGSFVVQESQYDGYTSSFGSDYE